MEHFCNGVLGNEMYSSQDYTNSLHLGYCLRLKVTELYESEVLTRKAIESLDEFVHYFRISLGRDNINGEN